MHLPFRHDNIKGPKKNSTEDVMTDSVSFNPAELINKSECQTDADIPLAVFVVC